jgi:hypothetical protein
MKKLLSIQPSTSQEEFFLTRGKPVQLLTGFFFTLSFLLIVLSTNGQQIQELNNKLALMKASPDPLVRAEGVHLESLVYNLQPTLYFDNGQLEIVPEASPVRVNTDVSSLSQVINSRYNQVEILVIRIQNPVDLQMSLQLSGLSAYSNLKYVYFLCSFELCPEKIVEGKCEKEKIANMVNIGDNSGIGIVYSVSIPS